MSTPFYAFSAQNFVSSCHNIFKSSQISIPSNLAVLTIVFKISVTRKSSILKLEISKANIFENYFRNALRMYRIFFKYILKVFNSNPSIIYFHSSLEISSLWNRTLNQTSFEYINTDLPSIQNKISKIVIRRETETNRKRFSEMFSENRGHR